MEHSLGEALKRIPHATLGGLSVGTAITSRGLAMVGHGIEVSGTIRAAGEHVLMGFGVPLLGLVFSDLFKDSGNPKLRTAARGLSEVNPFLLYLLCTVGTETMQIVDHGRFQYEQVASDIIGIGLGLMTVGILDRLTRISKRPWQKEKLDFSFLRKKK